MNGKLTGRGRNLESLSRRRKNLQISHRRENELRVGGNNNPPARERKEMGAKNLG